MKLSNKIYDILKWLSLVLLPAISVLYATLSPVWGLENVEPVVVTINAIGLFIGAVIGVSSNAYAKTRYDGVLNVLQNGAKKTFDLALDHPPEKLEGQKEVIFKIRK